MSNSSEVAVSSPVTPAYSRPDWVILGTPQPNGQVMVLASKKLQRAELEAKREEFEVDYRALAAAARFSRPRYFLRVEMSDWMMILADTYEQALRALFEAWSPDPARPALEAS